MMTKTNERPLTALVRIAWNRDVQNPRFAGEYQCTHRSGLVNAVTEVPIVCPTCNQAAESRAARMFNAGLRQQMFEVRQLMVERDAYRTALETLLAAATTPTWSNTQYDVLPLNAEGQPIGPPERVDVVTFLAANRESLVDRPDELVRILRLPTGEVWPTGGGASGGFLIRRA